MYKCYSDKGEKRSDYLAWDEYFMAVTFLEIRRSENTDITDAAIILNRRQIIVSMESSSASKEESNGESYINHAEYKALRKIQEGTVMYCTSFPCVKCAEVIVSSGIEELIYYQDNVNSDDAREVLKQGGVSYRQFVNNRKIIEIDFSQYDDDCS
ncbi:deoxycytidylate deaminase-like isoform X2 [Zophobas morio]|uniref:deoxycytidylate deaminase-like isoform X2 n=1 Tax=Zophobas morio TaxID=2755281 RepID=UPI003082A107